MLTKKELLALFVMGAAAIVVMTMIFCGEQKPIPTPSGITSLPVPLPGTRLMRSQPSGWINHGKIYVDGELYGEWSTHKLPDNTWVGDIDIIPEPLLDSISSVTLPPMCEEGEFYIMKGNNLECVKEGE